MGKQQLGIDIDIDKLREDVIERAAEQLVDSMQRDSEGYAREGIIKANQKAIDDAIKNTIDSEVMPIVKGQLDKITMKATNQWGEVKGAELTFKEYLVALAENYIREPVDFQGKAKGNASYNWSASQTRIAHMVHEHLHYSIEAAMKDALKNANATIVGGIEAAIKLKLAEVQASLRVNVVTK